MMNACTAQRSLSSFFWRAAVPISALAASLVLSVCLHAQAAAAAPPRSLQIMILEGEGALNNVQARTAREPIVQVQDENHKPVAGAVVLFTIHGESAGGTFVGGATQFSVTTGPDGTAAAHGLSLNQNTGSWQIGVSATEGALTASTVINEINFAPPLPPQPSQSEGISILRAPHWFLSKPILLLAGGIAVGAVVSVVVLDPPAGNGTQIIAGGSTVGPPTSGASIRIRLRK